MASDLKAEALEEFYKTTLSDFSDCSDYQQFRK